ncbi:MAG TPA: histidine phosphatase family protein [Bryobacteraceae bacterium]|nr:histidine phosphatase family protein [Bryobacteraceae bacterium]
MSTLVLVRHAQATAFEKDTDRLSAIGEQQSIRLGEYWRELGVQFDEVYTGTMQRHLRTAELAGFSKYESNAAFNEYDAYGILRSSPNYQRPTDNRQLQNMFDATMPQWIAGTLVAPGLETFQAFRDRVLRAFRAILDADWPSRRVVIFTSGGPIGVAVQTVLRAPEPMAIELNWRIRNCSLTEFLFTRGRVSLDTFNATPHLREVTYR